MEPSFHINDTLPLTSYLPSPANGILNTVSTPSFSLIKAPCLLTSVFLLELFCEGFYNVLFTVLNLILTLLVYCFVTLIAFSFHSYRYIKALESIRSFRKEQVNDIAVNSWQMFLILLWIFTRYSYILYIWRFHMICEEVFSGISIEWWYHTSTSCSPVI